MKLAFGDGLEQEISLQAGRLSAGTADDADVRLEGDLLACHAEFVLDQRGLVLEAHGSKVHVNDRPIEQVAILRPGDTIHIGTEKLVIRRDKIRASEAIESPRARTPDMPSRIGLRSLAGRNRGAFLGIDKRLRITLDETEAGETDGNALAISSSERGLWLTTEVEGVEINGHPRKRVRLRSGDQIVAGNHRFVVETPDFVPGKAYGGMQDPAAKAGNTMVFSATALSEGAGGEKVDTPVTAAPLADEERSDRGRTDFWIVAVCVLICAGLIAWLLIRL